MIIASPDHMATLRRTLDMGFELTPRDARAIFEANDACLRSLYETYQLLKRELATEAK